MINYMLDDSTGQRDVPMTFSDAVTDFKLIIIITFLNPKPKSCLRPCANSIKFSQE